jgi:VanZ family protein
MKMVQSARGRVMSYLLPPMAWALLIFIESSVPSSDIPNSAIFEYDKLIHLGIYFVLAFLVYRAFSIEGVSPRLRSLAALLTVALVALFGASDEYHQHFVPGRSMEFFDWVADSLGAVLAVAVHTYLTWRKSRKQTGT